MKQLLTLALISINLVTPALAAESELDTTFRQAAEDTGLDIKLLRAVCWVESNHKVSARKHKDGKDGRTSHGVCQIKYNTAKDVGYVGLVKDLYKPENNILYAAKYLARQMSRYNNSWKKAVTAYNRGSYTTSVPLDNEYVKRVALAIVDGR